jgi:septal ring factor EnvC (AmiA/AmiB activator)
MSNSAGRPVSPEQAQAKASTPPGQQNTTGAITVDNRGYLKSFKKTSYEKMVKDKATADFDLRTAEDTIQKQEELMSSKDSEITTLTSEVTEAQNEATALKHQNTTLKTTLQEAMQALKDAGKHSKKEEKKDIKRAISKWIKDVGFRNTKFAKGDKLTRFAKTIYSRIKGDLHLMDEGHDHHTPEVEFVRIYEPYIQTVLGERRQYVQTMLFEVAKSKSLYFVLAPKYRATLNFFELLLRMVEEARKLASN